MRYRNLASLLLAFACCAPAEQPQAAPNAAFDVSFGNAPPVTVIALATANSATNRLLVQLVDSRITLLLSVAWPPVSALIQLDDVSNAVIWAKLDSGSPLVATSGTVEFRQDSDRWSIVVTDAMKPNDELGDSLTIVGNVHDLLVP